MTLNLIVISQTENRNGRFWWLYDVDRNHLDCTESVGIPLDWCCKRSRLPATNPFIRESLERYLASIPVDLDEALYLYCGDRLFRFWLNRLASAKWNVRVAEIAAGAKSPPNTFTLTARQHDQALILAVLAIRRDVLGDFVMDVPPAGRGSSMVEQVCVSSCRAAGSSPAPDHHDDTSRRGVMTDTPVAMGEQVDGD